MAGKVRLPIANFWATAIGTATTNAASLTVALPSTPSSPPSNNFKPYGILRSLSASIAAGATPQAAPLLFQALDNNGAVGTSTLWAGYLGAPTNGATNLVPAQLAMPFYGSLSVACTGTSAATVQVAISASGEFINYGDV